MSPPYGPPAHDPTRWRPLQTRLPRQASTQTLLVLSKSLIQGDGIEHCHHIIPFWSHSMHHNFYEQYPAPVPSPRLQGKALRLTRICAMPFFGGQPLPRRLLTCPAFRRFGHPRSPIHQVVPGRSLWPVGSVIAFLRQARRSRLGAGWGSPRVIACDLLAGAQTNRGHCSLETLAREKQRV